MKIGLIGLGKMGQAIAYRLLQHNHTVFGYDADESVRETLRDGPWPPPMLRVILLRIKLRSTRATQGTAGRTD